MRAKVLKASLLEAKAGGLVYASGASTGVGTDHPLFCWILVGIRGVGFGPFWSFAGPFGSFAGTSLQKGHVATILTPRGSHLVTIRCLMPPFWHLQVLSPALSGTAQATSFVICSLAAIIGGLLVSRGPFFGPSRLCIGSFLPHFWPAFCYPESWLRHGV